MFFLYSILYSIAIFFLFPFEYLKRPADLRKRWVREKFGFLGNSEIGKLVSEKSPHPPFAKGGQGGIIVGLEDVAASPKQRFLALLGVTTNLSLSLRGAAVAIRFGY